MTREILTESESNALEQMIDRTTLAAVLTKLAEIADLKASHVRETWQDAALAREWERASARVVKVADALPLVPGIREG